MWNKKRQQPSPGLTEHMAKMQHEIKREKTGQHSLLKIHSLAAHRHSSLALSCHRTAPSPPLVCMVVKGHISHLHLLFHFSHYRFSTNRTKTTSAKQWFYPQVIYHQRQKTALGKGHTKSPSLQGPAEKPRPSPVTETSCSTGSIPFRCTRNYQMSWCEGTGEFSPIKERIDCLHNYQYKQ